MKKLTLFFAALSIAFGFSACKKDDNGGGTEPQVNCKLKSAKEVISASGSADKYGGFVLYYSNNNQISKANFIDSTTGNEDSTSYALLSYSSNNLTDIKIFQKGQELINLSMTYSTQNKVEQRFFEIPTPFGAAKVSQTFFYNSNGYIAYSIRRTQVDNVPAVGKVITKDSAIYQNYNSFGRPSGIVVFRSTTTSQGTQPYDFEEELAYEYDANGNRTKISSKSDVSDPFEIDYTATFDGSKTPGEAKDAYTLITKLSIEGWADPNLDSKDIDQNLILTKTEYDNGQGETTTTTYTFNGRGNPETAKETSSSETKNTTFTYECK